MSAQVFRTHTKTIKPSMLHQEMAEFFGDKFCGIQTLGDDVFRLGFTEELTPFEDAQQVQIVNAHVPSSMLLDTKAMQDNKCSEGFDLYKKIIAHINNEGGFSTVDAGRTAYKVYLTPVRDMLKDGFPEFAFREIVIVISPTGMFSTEQIDLYKGWIKDFGVKYGTPDAVFDALAAAPEGQI